MSSNRWPLGEIGAPPTAAAVKWDGVLASSVIQRSTVGSDGPKSMVGAGHGRLTAFPGQNHGPVADTQR